MAKLPFWVTPPILGVSLEPCQKGDLFTLREGRREGVLPHILLLSFLLWLHHQINQERILSLAEKFYYSLTL